MRMADAEALPFDFRVLYKTINTYSNELIALANDMRETTAFENQVIANKNYTYAGDPTVKLLPPAAQTEVPFLNFSSLQNSLSEMEKATTALATALAKEKRGSAAQDAINQSLFRAEQQLLSDAGLPRRSWYRHMIYAPGFYTGYGVKTLPGIREAIEQRNWKEAQEQIEVAAGVLKKFSAYLDMLVKTIS
jgi:N-acetylated-alpha-linked acidic dipeptidase